MKLYILSAAILFTFSTADISLSRSLVPVEKFQDKNKKKKDDKKKDQDKKGKKSGNNPEKKNPKIPKTYNSPYSVSIGNTWSLPSNLHEISGISFIDEKQVACIQDETGEIFIYDLSQKKIVRTIPFAGPGDYEGIAYVKGQYYVLRSDGMILKVDPSKPSNPDVIQTSFNLQNNCEGLHYDQKNNRLLIAIKGIDPTDALTKGIYMVDLATGKQSRKPVATIDLQHEMLSDTSKKKDVPQRRYHPSDLAIDPKTGDFLIVNGVNSSLMILGKDSKIRTIISLDKKTLPQPEGIAYAPSGKLYISTEGASGVAVIAECTIIRK